MHTEKPHLVLDVGGVLLANITPVFWEEAAELIKVPYSTLRSHYKDQIRQQLWDGTIREEEFWAWLQKQSSNENVILSSVHLTKHLQPLPAWDKVKEWSESFQIHLLSNHRAEWIIPALEPIRDYITSMTISSTVGCSKPDAHIFQLVQEQLSGSQPIVFVDDAEQNLAMAKAIGWTTILADADHQWIDEVKLHIQEMNGKKGTDRTH